MNAAGLMLCDDLIFFSRVSGTARASGLVVKQVRTATAMVHAARQAQPNCVILDLQNEGLDLSALLTQLHEACPAMPRTVAFGSHVEAETLRAARQLGCDLVMPRSQFAEKLEGSLKEWLGEARAVANVQNSE